MIFTALKYNDLTTKKINMNVKSFENIDNPTKIDFPPHH